jgi:hypothetical protein
MLREIIAYSSLIIGISTPIPYVIGTLRGRVKPQRITWLLFMLLNVNFLISAVMTGGNVLFTIGQFVGPLVIFALAIRYGVGGKTRLDIVSLALALVAFALLFVVDDAIIGLMLTLFIDLIGAMLTIKKLVKDRTSESKLTWGLSALAGLLGLVSLANYSVENLVFPLYIFLFATFMFVMAKSVRAQSSQK